MLILIYLSEIFDPLNKSNSLDCGIHNMGRSKNTTVDWKPEMGESHLNSDCGDLKAHVSNAKVIKLNPKIVKVVDNKSPKTVLIKHGDNIIG